MSRRPDAAPVFAALGDGTRLGLIGRLSRGGPHSISKLAEDSVLTRQAITKHLRILETAGLVHSRRRGRELLFKFTPKPIDEARKHLALVSDQWGQTLARLKSFVEESP